MIAQPIDYALIAWFVLAIASTCYVAYDQFAHNPEPAVMKWGFVLVTLYMGPIALLLYVMADKEPAPGTHEMFIRPLWKQGIGSAIHCVAGDATGIITAAAITALLGLPMWVDLIVEYVAGFSFGLLVFQSLFMKNMMGGTYLQNVRRTFLPEFISMNCMMAGMAPVMSLLMMSRDMRAMQPTELAFWGVMSLGVAVGFAVAYPVNVWMVSRNMKHGLMTERDHDHAKPSHGERQEHGSSHASGGHEDDSSQGHDREQRKQRTASVQQGAQRHANAGHGRGMRWNVTAPQLASVTGITLLALVAGMALPGLFVNLRLGAHDVGSSIMPPGMIMGWDTPGDAMKDMSAVLPRQVRSVANADARGAEPLAGTLQKGVRTFELTAAVTRWTILPGIDVDAYAFNGQVPGPTLQVNEGERVRIHVRNELPEATSVHWHGMILPNVMDGAGYITQAPIPPGGDYAYEFDVRQAGTYFYHTHTRLDRQQSLGLYGALIIAPREAQADLRADHDYVLELQEWLQREGLTYPAMPMEGALPNYFTINGKAYPSTDTVRMKVGETIRIRFIGSNNIFIHPMHIHGGPFTVVARDGETLAPAQRFEADTINVGPGQRYDVIWKAREPGKWLVHCHIGHHTTNNNTETNGGGGLMMVLDVSDEARPR